jgi:DNA-binding CsgD family transcriptional regulator
MLDESRDEPVSSSVFGAALDAAVMALAGLVRPSATVFYAVGKDNEPSGFELFGLAEAMHRTYLQRYCMLDPLHPAHCARQTRNVLTLASALPEPARDRSVYWRRFLQPHQVVDVMEVLLREGTRTVAAFSLLRMTPAEAFSADELSRARAVQPLLEAVLVPLLRRERPMRTHTGGRPALTHREQQIARRVRNGMSNKQIASDLALAQPTVKTHLLHMFRKLGVSSRTELIGALFL